MAPWATLVIVNALPVWPVRARKVRRSAVVEVAPTVKTALASAEEVPTAVMSVKVWSLTKVPSSCQPETLEAEAEIAPQITLPEASVVKAFELEQVGMVVICIPPPETMSPEARVEVEFVFVCKMFPPVIVSPEAEERPPIVDTLIPPENVEVAVEEELIPPPA